MTLPILHRTVREADPRRNYRLRDFLSTLGLHPVFVPDPGPVAAIEAAPAAEAEAPAEVPQCDCQQDPRSEGEVPAAQDVAAVIADGQAQAEQGETAGRGSFAEHAEEPSPLAPPAPYGLPSVEVPAGDEPAETDAAPDAEAAK